MFPRTNGFFLKFNDDEKAIKGWSIAIGTFAIISYLYSYINFNEGKLLTGVALLLLALYLSYPFFHLLKKLKKSPTLVILGIIGLVIILIILKNIIRIQKDRQARLFDFGNQTMLVDSTVMNFKNDSFKSSDNPQKAVIINKTVNPENSRAAAIIIDSSGGTGIFYLLVGGMHRGNKIIYSKPVSLGDRIKMISLNLDNPGLHDNGTITVRYFDRPQNVPITDPPTIAVTKKYAFQDDGNLIEVNQ
ncbi:MAG TPA: hypothetical protein VG917_01125 [Patescibacteria group bacterium]|nr:hypothetical protein [Patescibacteria group bacterium]